MPGTRKAPSITTNEPSSGKRPGGPAGAGPVAVTLEALDRRNDVTCPVIVVDLMRIGEVKAMVDSGAKFSAVSEDVYRRTTIPMQAITSPWAFADGTVINNVIGEINVLVRYRDSVVELFRVAVIRGLQRQLILGVD